MQGKNPSIPVTPQLSHYKTLYLIRTFETLLLKYFSKGVLRGTTHTYLGQEAISTAALSFLGNSDIVTSNHRSHGHFISYCSDWQGLLKEITGAHDGTCSGFGGSQHLQHKNFYSNGILGGMVPVGTGMALAEKIKGSGAVSLCFFGDGALGEGVVYESFNIASKWSLPILYIIENNQYAQSTPIKHNLAGSIVQRARAFGIETEEIESNDIGQLLPAFQNALDYIRRNGKPFCQIINTYRMGPHSKGDDVRDPAEINSWKEKDPLVLAQKYFDPSDIKKIESEVTEALVSKFENIIQSAASENSQPGMARLDCDDLLVPPGDGFEKLWFNNDPDQLLVNHLNSVLHDLFERNQKVCLIGEDLLDPYGGAFKVSKGLQAKFPNRVFSSPVSEGAIVGISNGMALRGLTPIVEIMFGDFTTLIVDQILNHATKFKRMYGGKVKCPIIVRTPMGGYRGYGPTHSQSLEKLFLGIPGLTVVASDIIHNQKLVWEQMLKLESPCLYVENKASYSQRLLPFKDGKIDSFHAQTHNGFFPTTELQLPSLEVKPDLVIFTYGGMIPMAMDVAKALYIDDEIVVKIIVPSQISPLPKKDLLRSLDSCLKVLVLEEGTERNGWGSELAAILLEEVKERIIFRRCAAKDTILPSNSAGEQAALPSKQSCLKLIREEILSVV